DADVPGRGRGPGPAQGGPLVLRDPAGGLRPELQRALGGALEQVRDRHRQPPRLRVVGALVRPAELRRRLVDPRQPERREQPAQAEVWIQGERKATVSVPPGGTATPSFPGLLGGPVRVVVTNQVPILVGQRTVHTGNFNEVALTSPEKFGGPGTSQQRYFPWYDYAWAQGGAWVLVANPGGAVITAEVR